VQNEPSREKMFCENIASILINPLFDQTAPSTFSVIYEEDIMMCTLRNTRRGRMTSVEAWELVGRILSIALLTDL
jgi:hypothetical protein